MKSLRITAITTALSLFPIGQPLLVNTLISSTAGKVLSIPKANANTENIYIKGVTKKYEKKKLQEAILDLDKAIKINKNNDISHALRGIINRELKNFEADNIRFHKRNKNKS